MLSRVIIFVLSLAILAVAQDTFDSDGKPFSRVQNRYKEPKVVVDTVRFAGQYASLSLRTSFTTGNHAVSATSAASVFAMITPALDDSTKSLYYYGYSVTSDGARLIIKSSNANDSSKVVVVAWIK